MTLEFPRTMVAVMYKKQQHNYWSWSCANGHTGINAATNIYRRNCPQCYNQHRATRRPPLQKFYDISRSSAINGGAEWTLTLEEFLAILPNPCTYCGATPRKRTKLGRAQVEFYAHGLDRIDCQSPYSVDNVVSCCWACNRMKHTMSVSQFLEHVGMIHKHQTQHRGGRQ